MCYNGGMNTTPPLTNSYGTAYQYLSLFSKRGFIKIWRHFWQCHWYDIINGTNTHGYLRLQDFDTQAVGAKPYQPVYTDVLTVMFNELAYKLNAPMHLVDYGCGKGKVLIEALSAGAKQVTGVDINAGLLNDCAVNLQMKHPNHQKATLIRQDAIDFDVPDDANVFFFFNPFSEYVMAEVFLNIWRSKETNPRQIFIIYVTPKHRYVLSDYCKLHRGYNTYHEQEALIYELI